MTRIASDGIDVSLSRNIVIDCNACTEFRPAPGAHPDCFQLWSRPAAPPTADIVITSNSAVGDMQGISLFNHVRDGANDGGFDRVLTRGNIVLNTYGDGISVLSTMLPRLHRPRQRRQFAAELLARRATVCFWRDSRAVRQQDTDGQTQGNAAVSVLTLPVAWRRMGWDSNPR
jgi:hypothetical protein